jgi:beta-galactosidase
MPTHHPWPLQVPGLGYGGDYNPEQRNQDVQLEDIELMKEAGVNLLGVGIFSWAMLEPREGAHDFGRLDTVLDRLHAAGIRVALATATASP